MGSFRSLGKSVPIHFTQDDFIRKYRPSFMRYNAQRIELAKFCFFHLVASSLFFATTVAIWGTPGWITTVWFWTWFIVAATIFTTVVLITVREHERMYRRFLNDFSHFMAERGESADRWRALPSIWSVYFWRDEPHRNE